jgi:hypothetical protein
LRVFEQWRLLVARGNNGWILCITVVRHGGDDVE